MAKSLAVNVTFTSRLTNRWRGCSCLRIGKGEWVEEVVGAGAGGGGGLEALEANGILDLKPLNAELDLEAHSYRVAKRHQQNQSSRIAYSLKP